MLGHEWVALLENSKFCKKYRNIEQFDITFTYTG